MPANSATSDPDLLESSGFLDRLRAGEDRAFTQFVTTLTPRLLTVAQRITGSDADAQDAVQEAFLAAFRALGGFDGSSSLQTWMHRILVNAALSRLRARKARRSVSIEELQPEFADGRHTRQPTTWQTGPQTYDVGPREIEALWQALDQLPQEFRDVLVLRDAAGLESKAVAAALGLSDALVRQRLHRGRQALVRLLEPVMTEVSP